jgi:peptidoglycan hydrolase CwlO-like protein
MKPLTLILCVIAILGSVASTFFFFQIGTAKEQLQQEVALAATRATEQQAKITEAAAQSEALQKRLAALDSELGEAKSKASAADARSTQLGREAAQLRNQLTAKTEAGQALTAELSQLKQELAQVKLTAATTAAEQSEAYKATIAGLQARITDLVALNTKANPR